MIGKNESDANAEMQQALLQLGRDIDRESRSNLERALAACSPSEPQQARP